MKPQRIQLSRKKGWRMPPNTVKVDRTTKWGNPYPVEQFGLDLSLLLYRRTLQGYWTPDGVPKALLLQAYQAHNAFRTRLYAHAQDVARTELRGKYLACWCPLDRPCHADVLLEIANQ